MGGECIENSSHIFSDTDRGFANFCDIETLKSCSVLSTDGDTFEFTIRIEIQALEKNLHDYDSRKMTGMVGLDNLGATCYLNALLQVISDKFIK